jgi:hypothetical protein
VKNWFILIVLFSILLGQNSIANDSNPCNDPLIQIALNSGIKAIPIKDIPKFQQLVKKCEKQGGSKITEQIYLKDWNRDFNSSHYMKRWTSTFSVCVFLTMVYYFAGLGLATK